MANAKTHKTSKIGLGLAAAAAAVAGAYYFYGKDGARHRRETRARVNRAKEEIARQMDKFGDVSYSTYNKLVGGVTKGYQALQKVDADDLAALTSELREYWNKIKNRTIKKRPAGRRS